MGGGSNAMTKVSLRNIRAYKLRLALTVLAVVLGTAFIAGSMMFTNMLERTFDSAVATQYSGADVVVEPGENASALTKAEADAVAATDGVDRVNVSAYVTVVAATTDEQAIQTRQGSATTSIYYGPDEAVGKAPNIVEGVAPHSESEAILNRGGAQLYGIELGQELIVVDTSGRHTYHVVGLYEDEVVQATSLNFRVLESTYLDFYAADDSVPGLVLSATEATSPQDLEARISQAHPQLSVRTGEVAAEEASQSVRDALSFISYFLIAFGLVGLLVGTFLIANTFSMIVAQRTKEFALLRALGASRGQITRSVSVEALVVGLIGSLLGVAGGAGLVAAIKLVMRSYNMDLPAGGIGFAADTVSVPVIVGVIVTMVSVWAPARQAGRVQPVAAMRASESAAPQPLLTRTVIGGFLIAAGVGLAIWALRWENGATADRAILVGVTAVAVIAGMFLAGPAISLPVVPPLGRLIGAPFGTVGKLASTNTQRNPRRTSATAFALMLGIALVTIIGMLGASMKHSVDDVAKNEVSAQYVLAGPMMGAFPIPRDLMERIPEVTGVGDVAAYTEAPLTINGDYAVQFGEFGMTPVLYGDPGNLTTMDMLAGSSDLTGDTVIAPRSWAEDHGWSVGDTVTVAVPGLSPEVVQATVGGIFENSSVLTTVVVSADIATRLAPPGSVNIIMLGANNDGTVSDEQLRANLENEVREDIVVQVQSKDDVSGEVLDIIDQMLFILYALLSLAVVIAVLGIINTLTLSVIERRQEIGMLRAVGTHRSQIRTMIILESVQIAFFGAVLGVLLGLGLGWAFLTVLHDKGLTNIVVPWDLVWVMLGGSVAVGIIAAVWPALRAAATPPLDAIAQ